MQVGINNYMIRLAIIASCLFIFSCKKDSNTIQLKFLDEYIAPNDLVIDSTLVGGLSGIDFYKGSYYLVCDDSSNPRYYKATITISNYKFDTVKFNEVVTIEAADTYLDLESIAVNPFTGTILVVSEGKINEGKDPSFFSVNKQGKLVENFEIPYYFLANSKQKPRDNGVFEGLSVSFDNKGYWVASELPLEADGPKPTWNKTVSPARFTYFNNTGKATKQVSYLLDSIAKKPLGDFAVNGVADVLAYNSKTFFVLERSFSTGYGNQGNTVKIYSFDSTKATNTLAISKLEEGNYKPVKKRLLFNLDSIRSKLTNISVDNIEGICFGPILPNGNKSLILISDNNFREDQLNQFILLEVLD